MCLEDPHYKPRMSPISKTNPFENLVQYRGVKKIFGGGPPNSYTTGVSDLFSSCFELPSCLVINKDDRKSPQSLPASPTLSRKGFNEEITQSTPVKDENCRKFKANSLFTHPLFTKKGEDVDNKPLIKYNSSTNISDCDLVTMSSLKRRGSCESGFFSSVGEDYHTCVDFTQDINHHPVVTRHKSTATLSSSSAASSLFFLDDSGTTVSSLRSLDDLDLPYTPTNSLRNMTDIVDARSVDMELAKRLAFDIELSNQITSQQKHSMNQLLYSSKRTSSIYTDSSEDVSSLGGSDIIHWDDKFSPGNPPSTGRNPQPHQIAKIVEYFERKGANFRHTTFCKEDGRWKPVPITKNSYEEHQSKFHHRFNPDNSSEYHFAKGSVLKMSDLHKIADGQSISELQRNSRIAALQRSLERQNLGQHIPFSVHNSYSSTSASGYPSGSLNSGFTHGSKKCNQRLMVCEGAVRSKLPLFDKK